MTVRISKPPIDLRSKLSELEKPIGLKGSELMRAETVQEARDLVSAGRKNMIINGDMRVAQRGTTTVSVGANASNGYLIHDRWSINNTGIDTLTANYSNENGDLSIGFRNSARLTCTASETLSAGERFSFETRIEAKDIIFLRWGTSQAKPITISFWVKSNLPGKYGVHVRHHDPGNAFVFPYTINQSDVWEYKTYTIPGDPYGTTNDDNGIGFWIRFMIASGDVVSSVADEKWSTTDGGPNTTPDAVNWGRSTGDNWEITGVQLEVGKNATEFEHRSYGEELALCQRYYQRMGDTTTNEIVLGGYSVSGSAIYDSIQLPVEMRIVPTLTQVGTFYTVRTGQPASLSGHRGRKGFGVAHTTTGTGNYLLATSPNAYFVLDAEL